MNATEAIDSIGKGYTPFYVEGVLAEAKARKASEEAITGDTVKAQEVRELAEHWGFTQRQCLDNRTEFWFIDDEVLA